MLWLSENGPECDDKLALVMKGGNYGWEPRGRCGDRPEASTRSLRP